MAAPTGNLNSARGREWTSALRRAMAHRADGDYRETLLKIANSVIDKALEGDKDAWREIAEREDGKASQALTLAGDENGAPVRIGVDVAFVSKPPSSV
jgi:hypothetical protein